MRKLATYLSFVRFSHTVFALPFALTGALLAAREHPVTWGQVAWIIVAMVTAVLGIASPPAQADYLRRAVALNRGLSPRDSALLTIEAYPERVKAIASAVCFSA